MDKIVAVSSSHNNINAGKFCVWSNCISTQ